MGNTNRTHFYELHVVEVYREKISKILLSLGVEIFHGNIFGVKE